MIDKKILLKLRKRTSLGMQVCKKALEEASGDFNKAIEILREKGKKIATKKLGRSIEKGAIFTKTNKDQTMGVLIALGCETDFAAKSDAFMQLCEYIADVAITKQPSSKEELLTLKGDQDIVQEEIIRVIGELGENILIAEYYFCQGPLVAAYTHTGNRIGSIVVLNQPGDSQEKLQAAKDMALQIVASQPLAIDEKGIAAATMEHEKELIQTELAKTDKPEQVKKKIQEGRIRKFIEKNTLLAQPFFKDEEMTNKDYLLAVAPDFAVVTFKVAEVAS